MSRGGARVWGNTHPAAQLTEKKVIRYRGLVRAGKATVGEIAAKEGCSHGRISMAMRGETWAHLNDVAPPVPGRPRGPARAAKSGRKAAVVKKTVAKTTAVKKAAAKKGGVTQGAGTTRAVRKGAVTRGTVAKGAVAKGTVKQTGGAKKGARTGARKGAQKSARR